MKKNLITYFLLAACVFAVICAPDGRDIVTTVRQLGEQPVVLIDPGHGGMDGGAEAADGTLEKDINLSIARILQKQLQDKGIRVIMTRTDDAGLYDRSGNATVRSMKTEDMKRRKNIIDETLPDLCISVHMNSFKEDPEVHGAQVFYASGGDEKLSADSRKAAEIIQGCLNHQINKDKARSELGKNDVFLLRNIACPTVIVECGFLSNREECVKLNDSRYRKKLASVITNGICKFVEEDKN